MASTSRGPESLKTTANNPIPSSSPAFGTPVHPINPRRTAPIRVPQVLRPAPKTTTVLPIILPPAILRPLAFRTFTKKHDLTLTSSALQALATFIGRNCGSGWREEGLAEKVLEEVAKSWKKSSGQVIVDGEGDTLKHILKTLEGSMSGGRITPTSGLSRQSSFKFGENMDAGAATTEARPVLDHTNSFGLSKLDVEDKEEEEDEALKDPRAWIQVVDAFKQPKLLYNPTRKQFEQSSKKPSLFPDPSHKTELFRQRYHLVHQRILRNETFQTPTFSSARSATLSRTSSVPVNAPNTITPIANLLGRSGSTHLLLGMITVQATGGIALSDLTGSIALNLDHAQAIPKDEAYFAPGMIVLVDGTYEEDYGNPTSGSGHALGNSGGVGGTIGGKFIVFSIGHPPAERRSTTLGSASATEKDSQNSVSAPAFGWTDFLGLGSQRATGARMSKLATKLLKPEKQHNIVIASDLHLDVPSTFSALRTLLKSYTPDPADRDPTYPLAVILIGNFSSRATLAGVRGAGSIEYKENFDALAALLSEYQNLIAHTTLIFVPGDNDAWPSAFSGGSAAPLPRKGVPNMFTNRIRRAVAEANREVWGTAGRKGGKEGEVIWATNPARLSLFGMELCVFRDDVRGRLQRNGIKLGKAVEEDEELDEMDQDHDPHQGSREGDGDTQDTSMDLDPDRPVLSKSNPQPPPDPSLLTSRALTRTLLSQAHLSPFPLSLRPLHWDFAHSLNLYPLPTALVLADQEAPPFVVKYCGCTVMNPGSIDESRGTGSGLGRREGRARWVEFDMLKRVGVGRVEG